LVAAAQQWLAGWRPIGHTLFGDAGKPRSSGQRHGRSS
jgi:hypothetical protein